METKLIIKLTGVTILVALLCTACKPNLTGTWHQVNSPSYTLRFLDNGQWESSTGAHGQYTVEGDTIKLQNPFAFQSWKSMSGSTQTAEIQGNEIILDGAHFQKE